MHRQPSPPSAGTLLRNVFDMLDGDIARLYAERGLAEYRPRFSPLVRALVADGPLSIRELAQRVGVTHSAASQTVAQMKARGLLTLTPGADARERIARLTPLAQTLLPFIEAEWAAAERAMRELDAELPLPLSDMLLAVTRALERRSFRDRVSAAGLSDGPTRAAPPPET
jgi:DNA-binding MarR family transcriptional regulator